MSESQLPATTPQPSAADAGAGNNRRDPVSPPMPERQGRGWLRGITRTVVVLGVISLFTDVSSEMIMPLRLLLLVQVLGTPLALAGLVEGIAEGATSVVKLFSGRLADHVADRRWLVIGGYSLSNLSKPLLALVTNWPLALGLVLLDRSGKSVRGSPRDAMIAESVPASLRGKAFGFHRSADTLGAALGPLLAIVILALSGNNLRAVFGWTIVPGVLSIVFALLFLRDSARRQAGVVGGAPPAETPVPTSAGPRPRAWQGFGARFWLFMVISVVFALGNSSDAFLFLRTEGLEASLLAVPMVYFGFNLVYALLATPLGAISDRIGRLPMLAIGFGTFTLVYAGWTHATATWHVWALFLLYGAYYAATEGVAKAFVSDLVPQARRGTALGWLGALTGFAALPANVLAAALWSNLGPGVTFGLGALLGAIALGLLIAWWPWLRENPVPWPQDPTPRVRDTELPRG